jgi:ribonuclease VapC
MVIDISAVAAILFQEPEARALAECIERDPVRLMSALNWLESHLVIGGRFGPQGALIAESFFRESRIQIVSMDAAHARTAHSAWLRFGKGRHPAGLNLGDCCAYAASVLEQQPLLCKGGDFSKTDLATVEY